MIGSIDFLRRRGSVAKIATEVGGTVPFGAPSSTTGARSRSPRPSSSQFGRRWRRQGAQGPRSAHTGAQPAVALQSRTPRVAANDC